MFKCIAYGLMILVVIGFPQLSAPAGAASSDGRVLVKKGIDQYNAGRLDRALETFQQAEKIFGESLAVPYYRGLIYLKKGDREKAVVQWRRYVAMAPQDEKTLDMRKQITLLLQRAAKAYARDAVARQKELLGRPVVEDTVAVAAFKNLGSDTLAPLGKGMAAMVIADLSQFEELKVVEREKLQALLAEMKLGTSGLVNEKNAPKVGKLLQAKYVTSGSLADPQAETLLIASVLFDAGRNATAGTRGADGELAKFYELEKEIACGIAVDLGQNCARAPEAFNTIHTKNIAALEAYSYGLDYADEEKYDEARAMFQKAVEEDPQFDLARAALLATPPAAMLLLTESQMISSASAGAPSAAAASTTAAVSVGSGGVGIGTTVAVAGGVVVAGGAAAMVAGGSDDNGNDTPEMDLNGRWQGVWSDPAGDSGSFTLQLFQEGQSVGGEAVVDGTDCISTAGVDGSCIDSRMTLNLTSASAEATLNAQTTSDSEMRGDITFTSGACAGSAIQVSAQKTGGAIVEW